MIKDKLKEAKWYLDSYLRRLNLAARTNNQELWVSAEDSFLSIIGGNRFGILPHQTKGLYLRLYHQIIPEEELIMPKEGLVAAVS